MSTAFDTHNLITLAIRCEYDQKWLTLFRSFDADFNSSYADKNFRHIGFGSYNSPLVEALYSRNKMALEFLMNINVKLDQLSYSSWIKFSNSKEYNSDVNNYIKEHIFDLMPTDKDNLEEFTEKLKYVIVVSRNINDMKMKADIINRQNLLYTNLNHIYLGKFIENECYVSSTLTQNECNDLKGVFQEKLKSTVSNVSSEDANKLKFIRNYDVNNIDEILKWRMLLKEMNQDFTQLDIVKILSSCYVRDERNRYFDCSFESVGKGILNILTATDDLKLTAEFLEDEANFNLVQKVVNAVFETSINSTNNGYFKYNKESSASMEYFEAVIKSLHRLNVRQYYNLDKIANALLDNNNWSVIYRIGSDMPLLSDLESNQERYLKEASKVKLKMEYIARLLIESGIINTQERVELSSKIEQFVKVNKGAAYLNERTKAFDQFIQILNEVERSGLN